MFEAKVRHGGLWKKLIEAIKDLVNEANFDCHPGGCSITAMDTTHVALVNLLLKSDGFEDYNCERNTILGLNLQSLSKVLKIVDNNDSITLRHENDSDVIIIGAESQDRAKNSEFQLKLMEIEAESMGIPDLEHRAHVSLSSSEFAKICRDMTIFGDTVTIDVTRTGVKFSASGDIGEGFAFLHVSGAPGAAAPAAKSNVKTEDNKKNVKKEVKGEVKAEVKAERDDDDVPLADLSIKREKGQADAASEGVTVDISEPVTLSFALRYLNTFAKGAALSDRVDLHLAKDSPCLIEYKIAGVGFLRYYLAPKVDDAEGN